MLALTCPDMDLRGHFCFGSFQLFTCKTALGINSPSSCSASWPSDGCTPPPCFQAFVSNTSLALRYLVSLLLWGQRCVSAAFSPGLWQSRSTGSSRGLCCQFSVGGSHCKPGLMTYAKWLDLKDLPCEQEPSLAFPGRKRLTSLRNQ